MAASVYAWLWERLCCGACACYVFGNALYHPAKFYTLTFWSLCLYACYHSVDKASPFAAPLVVLLHGVAFTGSISVFFGYGLMAAFGRAHHGSWYKWENAICKLNKVPIDPFSVKLAKNVFVHCWPVAAMAVDLWLSFPQLNACYAAAAAALARAGGDAAARLLLRVWFCLGYFCFGNAWQALTFSLRPGVRGKDVVERYQASPNVRKWGGRNDDKLFALLIKLSGTAVALVINVTWVLPLLFRDPA